MPFEQQLLIAPRSHGTRLLIGARSILLGWTALFAITYLLTRPLLAEVAPLLGASWLPTAQLTLECAALGAAGGIVRRFSGAAEVVVFAVSLAVWNFGLVPALNVPWLFRLAIDALKSSRYFESLVTVAATHALLFASLIAGARLSRTKLPPVSIAG